MGPEGRPPDGLPACPRCGGAKTAWAWGRSLCPRCRGDAVRLARGREAARAAHRATLARIAEVSPEPGTAVPLPPRVVVVRRTDPSGLDPPVRPRRLPACWPPDVPTLRERLRARRAAEPRDGHPVDYAHAKGVP